MGCANCEDHDSTQNQNNTLKVLIDFCPVNSQIGVLFTETFDILPEIIIESRLNSSTF